MKKDKSAQTIVEYIIIISFVFILSVLLTRFFSIMLANFLKNFLFIIYLPVP